MCGKLNAFIALKLMFFICRCLGIKTSFIDVTLKNRLWLSKIMLLGSWMLFFTADGDEVQVLVGSVLRFGVLT